MKQIFHSFRLWAQKQFIKLYLVSLEKKMAKQRKVCIKFSNPTELIEIFKGTVLIERGYIREPEKQYYIGDLIQGFDIASAMGELESGEANLTMEGKKFLEYAFLTSDLDEFLQKNEYRDDYIKNQDDLLNFRPANQKGFKDPMGRIFNLFKSEDAIVNISKHLGLSREVLQSEEILKYDASLRRKNLKKDDK